MNMASHKERSAGRTSPRRIWLSILIATAITFAGIPAVALEAAGAERLLDISADNFEGDVEQGAMSLRGNVKVEYGGMLMESGAMELDNETGEVSADGDISVTRDGLEFKGCGFKYNYKTGEGSLKAASARMEGMYFFSGNVAIFSDRVAMNDVSASTCPLDASDYTIRAKKVELAQDGRAKFNKISFHFKDRRLMSWPSYTMRPGGRGGAGSGVEYGSWIFSPPSLGYSDIGGAEIRSGVARARAKGDTVGLYTNYYFREGFFTEARWQIPMGDFNATLRFGKQFKENRGYFKYSSPETVWNSPTAELRMPQKAYRGARLLVDGGVEAGMLKEDHLDKAQSRAHANVNAKYILNPKQKIQHALISDARLGIYKGWERYRVIGSGLETSFVFGERRNLRIQYLMFNHNGETPFDSDMVNTNNKLFLYADHKISKRTSVLADIQYDDDLNKFDEVVIGGFRLYKCVKFQLAWRAKRKMINMSMSIKGPEGR